MARGRTRQGGLSHTESRNVPESADPYGSAFSEASERYGISETYLRKLAAIESSGNPQARRGSSVGLMQFQPAAAREMGLTVNRHRDDRLDPEKSIMAAAHLAAQNKDSLKSTLGRDPAEHELYMAHQQGLGGAAAILKDPDTSAAHALSPFYKNPVKAITGNGGDRSMSCGAFTSLWERKYADKAPLGGVPSEDSRRVAGTQPDPSPETPAYNGRTDLVARDVFGPSTVGPGFAFNDASQNTPMHEAALSRRAASEQQAANEGRSNFNVSFNSAGGGFGDKTWTNVPSAPNTGPEKARAEATDSPAPPSSGTHQGAAFHRDMFTPLGNG
ncbi:MAG: transglycosylase SLT domain-containing protein [Rhodospirillales bacterium]|nr:transglycosylase SLT domain-containing protein [Rhodospirillales bacterium]